MNASHSFISSLSLTKVQISLQFDNLLK